MLVAGGQSVSTPGAAELKLQQKTPSDPTMIAPVSSHPALLSLEGPAPLLTLQAVPVLGARVPPRRSPHLFQAGGIAGAVLEAVSCPHVSPKWPFSLCRSVLAMLERCFRRLHFASTGHGVGSWHLHWHTGGKGLKKLPPHTLHVPRGLPPLSISPQPPPVITSVW